MQTAKTDQTGRMPLCWICHEAAHLSYKSQHVKPMAFRLLVVGKLRVQGDSHPRSHDSVKQTQVFALGSGAL